MSRRKVTVSLPEEIVDYLRSTSNMSSTIAEAVAEYRDHRLEKKLEESYRAGAQEAEDLNREWEVVDAPDQPDDAPEPERKQRK
jgi:hypothetical protein